MEGTNGFPQTKINSVNRKKQRGAYDYKTIHSLLDSIPVLHVGFTPASPPLGQDDHDAFPSVLPMLGCTGNFKNQSSDLAQEPQDIYLHGYVSARLLKLPEIAGSQGDNTMGVPICVTGTSLDGLILSLTPFNHSCNYSSVVAYGYAFIVTDPDEKAYAMKRVTNNVVSDRWDNSRVPPTDAEFKSTGMLRVEIASASAKIRVGGPGDDRADTKNEEVTGRVWTGVVPAWVQYGEPHEGVDNKVKPVPEYLKTWVKNQNAENREKAHENMKDAEGNKTVKDLPSGLAALWKS